MLSLSLIAVFIPTFFFISITPGMCMMLAMTMGMTIGVKRTFWMMWGELLGVGIVATASVIGVATLMLQYPSIFEVFKYVGGAYLSYLGLQMWLSKGKMAVNLDQPHQQNASAMSLASQGFVTAIANPKGWAFFISLLPPFINQALPLTPQLVILLAMVLSIELLCLVLYATGGSTLSKLLQQSGKVRLLNRVSGSLMLAVGLWLAFG
ncbi:LysE family translocator [Spartinivicinus poritis]|uniref:LysE family translocator n=1 Tax=Spartinivicinus poritis TaxID=2994640 RepID=A0ABT5U7A6_9GAMM|nr:LysE family translocator [Spartinivicinus sp. A2-2]MDE1462250.1 LysE family translocator [Spartinivicinus sp. A2-2]